MLHHDRICRDKLWDFAKPWQINERRRYLELWQQLRSENAPLRVIDGDRLASAPISFFDELLMSFVTDHWQKVARVVGHALGSQMDDWIIQSGVYFPIRPPQCHDQRRQAGNSGRLRPRDAFERGEVTRERDSRCRADGPSPADTLAHTGNAPTVEGLAGSPFSLRLPTTRFAVIVT